MVDVDQIKLTNHLVCEQCNAVLNFTDNLFISFFLSEDTKCPICQNEHNIWKLFKNSLDQSIFGSHYSLLGCIGKIKKIHLKPNENCNLDLSNEIGDGELLFINYTPFKGGVFPIETHSNIPEPHIRRTNIHLHGYTLDENASETEISCFYWFAPAEIKDDLGMRLILDAFQRYYEKNYRYMVISAFTAVEISQYHFFAELLKSSGISYSNKIEPFLTHNATFSSQLRVLLPFLAEEMKFPMLNKPIYDGIENLRKDRNDVVHKGEPKKGWEQERLKNELISALFAYKYYKLILTIDYLR